MRLYDRLFSLPNPDDAEEGKTFKDYLNPDSLEVIEKALVEPSIAEDPPGSRYQFERLGYFVSDIVDSKPGHLVYNRTITLRDSWAKTAEVTPQPAVETNAVKDAVITPNDESESRRSKMEIRDEIRAETPALQERFTRYTEELGLPLEEADVLTGDLKLALFYDDGVAAYDNASSVSKWVTNEVLRELKDRSIEELPYSGADVAALAKLVDDGAITANAARDVFARLSDSGGAPADIVSELGLEQVTDADALAPIVDETLSAHQDKVDQYLAGKTGLLGFFIGQVMRSTQGKANPEIVRALVQEKLGQQAD